MRTNRKQIRLKKYDYAQSGYYFVTICTQNRECLFGNIINNVGAGRDRPVSMILNQYGKIVENVWESLPDHHSVELDTFQIMPNHVHFILHIVSNGLQTNDSGTSRRIIWGASRRAPTLGWIVGIFKTECTKQINTLNETPGRKIFQRNYYEHIIRNENELFAIRKYIKENPQ